MKILKVARIVDQSESCHLINFSSMDKEEKLSGEDVIRRGDYNEICLMEGHDPGYRQMDFVINKDSEIGRNFQEDLDNLLHKYRLKFKNGEVE